MRQWARGDFICSELLPLLGDSVELGAGVEDPWGVLLELRMTNSMNETCRLFCCFVCFAELI